MHCSFPDEVVMQNWRIWYRTMSPLTRKRWVAFVVYCWFNALLFLGFVMAGVLSAAMPGFEIRLGTNLMFMSSGTLIFWFLPLSAVFFIAPLLPKTTWAWRFNVMVLCLGVALLFLLPVAILILAFWLSEEMQTAYGQSSMAPGNVLPPPSPA
jgi:hypothetical protein